MRKLILASAPVLALAVAAPAFSQGSTQTPPAPNAATAVPQGNSVPPGAATMAPSGIGREGSITTTTAPTTGHHSRRARRRAARRARMTPDAPAAQTVPAPANQ